MRATLFLSVLLIAPTFRGAQKALQIQAFRRMTRYVGHATNFLRKRTDWVLLSFVDLNSSHFISSCFYINEIVIIPPKKVKHAPFQLQIRDKGRVLSDQYAFEGFAPSSSGNSRVFIGILNIADDSKFSTSDKLPLVDGSRLRCRIYGRNLTSAK